MFSSLPVGRHLLPPTTLNSTKMFYYFIPILCFVAIHWIQRKSPRKNWIIKDDVRVQKSHQMQHRGVQKWVCPFNPDWSFKWVSMRFFFTFSSMQERLVWATNCFIENWTYYLMSVKLHLDICTFLRSTRKTEITKKIKISILSILH